MSRAEFALATWRATSTATPGRVARLGCLALVIASSFGCMSQRAMRDPFEGIPASVTDSPMPSDPFLSAGEESEGK